MFILLGTFFVLPALVVGQLYPAPNNPPPATTAAAAVSVPSAPPSTVNQINVSETCSRATLQHVKRYLPD